MGEEGGRREELRRKEGGIEMDEEIVANAYRQTQESHWYQIGTYLTVVVAVIDGRGWKQLLLS